MDYAPETSDGRASMGGRGLDREAFRGLLRSGNVDRAVDQLRQLPGRRFLHPLLSALCGEEKLRWSAVTALGVLVADLAGRDLESARVVMRRLMWNLTEECGGIAWGVPESMGEIMARHETLAREYVQILVSYLREDGNFLEYEPLQRGLIWGIGRLAQVERELLVAHHAGRYLLPCLSSGDGAVRGLAAWALGLLGTTEAGTRLEELLEDREEIRLYLDRRLVSCSVGDLARQALDRIRGR